MVFDYEDDDGDHDDDDADDDENDDSESNSDEIRKPKKITKKSQTVTQISTPSISWIPLTDNGLFKQNTASHEF